MKLVPTIQLPHLPPVSAAGGMTGMDSRLPPGISLPFSPTDLLWRYGPSMSFPPTSHPSSGSLLDFKTHLPSSLGKPPFSSPQKNIKRHFLRYSPSAPFSLQPLKMHISTFFTHKFLPTSPKKTYFKTSSLFVKKKTFCCFFFSSFLKKKFHRSFINLLLLSLKKKKKHQSCNINFKISIKLIQYIIFFISLKIKQLQIHEYGHVMMLYHFYVGLNVNLICHNLIWIYFK